MPRAVDGRRRKNRRQKILKLAKGFWGGRSRLFKTAKDAVAKAGLYAYRDRRARKAEMRSLWIARLSAACRQHELTYAGLMQGLKLANIQLNRKALSNMAIEDPTAFAAVAAAAKASLGAVKP